nr:hypothetical protein [Candidatus Arsenophonus triatominarum]
MLLPRSALALTALFESIKGKCTGLSVADSTPIAVCDIARRLNFDYSICIKNRSSIVHPVSIFLRLA